VTPGSFWCATLPGSGSDWAHDGRRAAFDPVSDTAPAYTVAMRRWLTLLLLVVLPLQFTWAAAAGYCQHETSSTAGHFGHHQHEHKASSDGGLEQGLDGKSAAKLQGDADCSYCHLASVNPVQITNAGFAAFAAGAVIEPPIVPALRTRDPDRLERPNWLPA
jgi:hypothetical protein